MDTALQGKLIFFNKHLTALPLYRTFEARLLTEFPKTKIRVQKSQISFFTRYMYACVSFQRVKKKAELPNPYIVITLGLPYPLASTRVAVKTEPYPGRWTTHIVIGSVVEIDDELISWLQQAYSFADSKIGR